MLVAKIITFILAVITAIIIITTYNNIEISTRNFITKIPKLRKFNESKICKTIIIVRVSVPIILWAIFSILMATRNITIIIGMIAVFVFVFSFLLYMKYEKKLEIMLGVSGIAALSMIVVGIVYFINIKKYEIPDVVVTKTPIICAKDNSVISGSMSGGIFYVQASVSEKSEYHYYYQQEDGGIKLGTIPADDTTIYYLDGKNAYLETTVTTTYYLDYNNNPASRWSEESVIKYKLYVPEGSVTNVYEFDAE